MAEIALQVAKESGLEVEVMDETAMEKAGMGGMLGVNEGSDEPPRLIKLTYSPRNPSGSVALVGKGIMFDSGGLSLKPADGMMSMKIDMTRSGGRARHDERCSSSIEAEGEGRRLPVLHRQHAVRHARSSPAT